MKPLLYLTICITAVTLCSCKDDKDSTPQPVVDECTVGTSKVTASVNGSSWCANQTLFADEAIVLTINGINKNGSSITFEIDSFAKPGVYPTKEMINHILYTDQMANGFESTDGNPGTLTVTQNDTVNNRFKANYNCTLVSPISGNLPVSGTIDVFYTE